MLDEQGFDLADRLPVAMLRSRASDPHFDILERRVEPFWPEAFFGCADRHQRFSACFDPAVAAQIAERFGHFAFHHHRGIVPGIVAAPVRRFAALVVFLVIARVPALPRHVDTTAYRQRAVEHGDLLVMA